MIINFLIIIQGLNEFDMPVMPKDNAQLEEFISLFYDIVNDSES